MFYENDFGQRESPNRYQFYSVSVILMCIQFPFITLKFYKQEHLAFTIPAQLLKDRKLKLLKPTENDQEKDVGVVRNCPLTLLTFISKQVN